MEITLESASIEELEAAISKIKSKGTQNKINKIDSGKFDVLRLDDKIHIYNHASNKNVTRGEDEKGTYIKMYYKHIK